jgi:hypothetical protein
MIFSVGSFGLIHKNASGLAAGLGMAMIARVTKWVIG